MEKTTILSISDTIFAAFVSYVAISPVYAKHTMTRYSILYADNLVITISVKST